MLKGGLLEFTLKQFCNLEEQTQILYEVGLKDAQKTWSRWAIPDELKDLQLLPNWKKPSPQAAQTVLAKPLPQALASYLLVNIEGNLALTDNLIQDAEADDIALAFHKEKLALIKSEIPKPSIGHTAKRICFRANSHRCFRSQSRNLSASQKYV